MCGRSVSTPLRVPGQGPFSVQQGIIRKCGSHKQEHKMTQSWMANDKEGSDGDQTWSVILNGMGIWECENI